MEVNLAVLADAANISKEGKLNILGIFDTLYAPSFPVTQPALVIVVRFEAHNSEAGDHSIKIRLADEDGREVAALDGTATLKRVQKSASLTIRTQIILGIHDLTLQRPGSYGFDILIDGRYERSVPLSAVQT